MCERVAQNFFQLARLYKLRILQRLFAPRSVAEQAQRRGFVTLLHLPSGSLESAAGRWEAGFRAADPSRAFGILPLVDFLSGFLRQ
jgi:hypothetical protein